MRLREPEGCAAQRGSAAYSSSFVASLRLCLIRQNNRKLNACFFGRFQLIRRIMINGLLLVVSIISLSVVQLYVQAWRVKRVMDVIARDFPIGMGVTQAQQQVSSRYPMHTRDSPLECEKNSRRIFPAYTARGGPCISVLVDVGTTWWGFESAVNFRLIFGGDESLVDLAIHPVYTFL